MSSDFSQLKLGSTTTIGADKLIAAEQKIKELETQITYYEEREVDHKDLEKHMRASYASFVRDVEELKKNLALAELRNQELKEEKMKMDAQLSGRIDLLLHERQEYQNWMEGERWCEIPRYQFVQMSYYCKHFTKLRVRVDLETNQITTVMPYEPVNAKTA